MQKFLLLVNNGYTVQDNPEPEVWVRPAAASGVRYLEYFADHMDPLYYERVIRDRSEYFRDTMRVLEENSIEVVSVGTGRLLYLTNALAHPYADMAEEGLRWCKGMVDLAAGMGAKFIAGHYDYITLTEIERDPDAAVERVLERLLRLAEYAGEKGLEAICLEQMYTRQLKPYTVEEGKYLIERLNAKADVPFYMHCDTGHMAVGPKDDPKHTAQDKDPYYWLRQTYGDTGKMFVHLQQTDAESSRHWPFTDEYNARGFIDADKVVEALIESGVKEAFLTFEILYPRATPIERIVPDIVESVEYFDAALKRHGFTGANGEYVREDGS